MILTWLAAFSSWSFGSLSHLLLGNVEKLDSANRARARHWKAVLLLTKYSQLAALAGRPSSNFSGFVLLILVLLLIFCCWCMCAPQFFYIIFILLSLCFFLPFALHSFWSYSFFCSETTLYIDFFMWMSVCPHFWVSQDFHNSFGWSVSSCFFFLFSTSQLTSFPLASTFKH